MSLRAWSLVLSIPLAVLACAGGDKDDEDEDEDEDDEVDLLAESISLPSEMDAVLQSVSSIDSYGDEAYVWGVWVECEGSDYVVELSLSDPSTFVLAWAWDIAGSGEVVAGGQASPVSEDSYDATFTSSEVGVPCGQSPVLFGGVAITGDGVMTGPSFGWEGEGSGDAIGSYGSSSGGRSVSYIIDTGEAVDEVRLFVINPRQSTMAGPLPLSELSDYPGSWEWSGRVDELGGDDVDDFWVGFDAVSGGETLGLAGT